MPLPRMRFIIVTCVCFACIAGCAGRSRTAAVERPAPLPGPSTVRISGTIRSEQFAVDGRVEAQVRAEAIAAGPLRSRYRGEMMLIVNQGARTLIDFNTVVEGEYDGSPTGGITQAIGRLLDALAATAPLERVGATTRPSAEAGE